MKGQKDLLISYLKSVANRRLGATKKQSESSLDTITNHRATSGINLKNKPFSYTPIVEKFDGVTIRDIDGNEYLDIAMGFGVHLFGHMPQFIRESIDEANHKSWGLGPSNPQFLELAKKVKDLTGVDRMAFFNTGTEAVMVAIRIARAYTRKDKIVIFHGAYHGHNDGTLVFKVDPMSGKSLPFIPGIPASSQADTILLDFNDPKSIDYIRAHADEIAAVLTEPVQSRNPEAFSLEFLQQLRSVTEEGSIALIWDEMITGFRIHPGGAQQYLGIKADLVTYGKIIGGGMPIGIVAGSAEYLDLIDGGKWHYEDNSLPNVRRTFVAGTFCGHPLTVAASLAVVNKLKNEGIQLIENLNAKVTKFVGELNTSFNEMGIPISLHSFGSLFRFQIPSRAKIFFHLLLLEGIYVWEGKTCFLSTAHTDADIDFLKAVIIKCARLLQAFGYFPDSDKETSRSEDVAFVTPPNHPVSVSSNIGACLTFTGEVDQGLLYSAVRYYLLTEPVFAMANPDELIQVHEVASAADTSNMTYQLINTDIRDKGLLFQILANDGNVNTLACAAHSSRFDGWSIGIIFRAVLELYEVFKSGKQLPDPGAGQRDEASIPHFDQIRSLKISPGEKLTFVSDFSLVHFKKMARQLGVHVNQFIMSAFAIALQRTVMETQPELTIGTPASQALKHHRKESLGANTFIEAYRYEIGHACTIHDLLKQIPTVSTDASVILNIDRIVGNLDTPQYRTKITPLDPDFIRYDLVINVLAAGKERLLIDFKWRKDLLDREGITLLNDTFHSLIKEEYAPVGSK